MPKSNAAPDTTADDTTKVYAWKADWLRQLGYRPEQAAVLADKNIDVHQVADLIRRGCPPGLAARIVL